MPEDADQVLMLRRQGKSFGAIARATGLGRLRRELIGDTPPDPGPGQ